MTSNFRLFSVKETFEFASVALFYIFSCQNCTETHKHTCTCSTNGRPQYNGCQEPRYQKQREFCLISTMQALSHVIVWKTGSCIHKSNAMMCWQEYKNNIINYVHWVYLHSIIFLSQFSKQFPIYLDMSLRSSSPIIRCGFHVILLAYTY